MRQFIRHPSSIPIMIKRHDDCDNENDMETLNNVSLGGLSCLSKRKMEEGTEVDLTIEHVKPPFEITGLVVWCKPVGDMFELGVKYLANKDEAYQLRMVEQICHIEHYRKELMLKEGVNLTSEEAAKEWISKHASEFPS